MNLMQHPDLLDRLAASYALGTLRHGARRRLETMARQQPAVQQACRQWQARLAGMTELQSSVAPPPHVWTRIENLLPTARQTANSGNKGAAAELWRRVQSPLRFWKLAAAAGAVATVATVAITLRVVQSQTEAMATLQARLAEQATVVAILHDQAAVPSLLVTLDREQHQWVLQRLTTYREADDRSLQLWALPAGGKPRSLGVLPTDRLMRVAASPEGLQGIPAIAISLEPKGGVPSERGPTGPVLFSGPVLGGVS